MRYEVKCPKCKEPSGHVVLDATSGSTEVEVTTVCAKCKTHFTAIFVVKCEPRYPAPGPHYPFYPPFYPRARRRRFPYVPWPGIPDWAEWKTYETGIPGDAEPSDNLKFLEGAIPADTDVAVYNSDVDVTYVILS